jgi:uncharacterized integral membrane protein
MPRDKRYCNRQALDYILRQTETEGFAAMHSIKIIGMLLLLALVAVFTFQNTETANVHFLFWSWSLYVWLLLLTSLFSGIVIGMVLSYVHTWQKNRRGKNAGLAGSAFPDAH